MQFAKYFTGGALVPGTIRSGKARIGGFDGAPTSDNTAGPLTITAAMLKKGILVRDPNGAGRTDVLPTAALIVSNFPGIKIGDVLRLLIINGADAAETITVAVGTGGGWDTLQIAGTRIIPQNTSRLVHIRMTAVVAGSEAYVAYM